MNFSKMFEQATGYPPYEYQERLAEADPWPDLLEAPTGAGKTEAIVLGWLWRWRFAPRNIRNQTARRLAYCLPMRVLVEQTEARVRKWLSALGWSDDVGVHLLMGGETDNDWDLHPEREAVLIGTQDMLLSRALNRGYALGRARWPLPFGLLNNDCLWAFDEVQLMGSGLATTAQLAAFREKFQTWGPCPSLWVSATLRPGWLDTVDFREKVEGLTRHELSKSEWRSEPLAVRLEAKKVLGKAKFAGDDAKKLAGEILAAHQPTTLTLAVVNTVKKAVALYEALKTSAQPAVKRKKDFEQAALLAPELLLLHSRFRAPDRRAKLAQLLAPVPEVGRIVVSTQVVEAGVDISARVLFTELSPWASFVQRVGRCNRKGEFKSAEVFWIDVDTQKKGNAAPYEDGELEAARAELKKMDDAGPRALRDYLEVLTEARRAKLYPYTPGSILRRRTLEELFDTTADLTDADLDVSLYIREADERDVQVFWREWGSSSPNKPEPLSLPARDELCAAPLNDVRDLLKRKSLTAWRWDFLESQWQRAEAVIPGQVYLLPAEAGHYASETGWTPETTGAVLPAAAPAEQPEGNDRDPYAQERKIWQTIAGHTNQVVESLEVILEELGATLTEKEQAALRHAARWHDWGKAYHVFQEALTAKATPDFALPPGHLWAKSKQKSERYTHPGFRHELAGALGMLSLGHPDLACYLVAAHHGKVRLSIRSLPTEIQPSEGRRFARGVWEGDKMETVKLGGGVVAPEMTLSLAPMELGLTDGQPSWAERMLQLLQDYGPFRLAYLEAVLCAADRRASAEPRPGGDE